MAKSKSDPLVILKAIANAVGVTSSTVMRYAASSQSRTATTARGWLDNLWHMVWGTRAAKPGFNYQLPTSTITQLTQLLNDPGGRVELGGGGGSSGGTSRANREAAAHRSLIQRAPPNEAELAEWSPEIMAPHSSNVYSFQYHEPTGRKGVLYVTYKAPLLNHGALSVGRGNAAGVTGKRQLVGTLGKTHRSGERPNSPGPKYAYSGVPKDVFYEMQAAAQSGGSVGKKVWDKLRIRHTHFGHKYPYILVSPSVHPSTGHEYIPRKATAKGYATRTVHGGGRFNFKTSTLAPSQTGSGFTTRKPRKG